MCSPGVLGQVFNKKDSHKYYHVTKTSVSCIRKLIFFSIAEYPESLRKAMDDWMYRADLPVLEF